MKLDQLQYFLETARLQHIGKAAKVLHISPSAISHSLRALEEELGCALFEKIGKNIYLSAQGKSLMPKAQALLDQARRVKEEMQADASEWEGRFRIGVTHGLSHLWVVPIWNQLQEAHPKVETEFYSYRSAQVVNKVARGELDFGVCFNPTAHPNLNAKLLWKQPLKIAVRRNHPILKVRSKDWAEELAKYSAALPKAFQGIEVCEDHPELKKRHIRSQVNFVFDSYEAGVAKVQNGDNWSLLPEAFIQHYNLISLDFKEWKATADITAVWPKGRPPARILEEFLKALER